ncbi:cobyrinic acid a,c-diamide synthase [Rhodovulum sulfidophilum]|uniref:Cobyrinic acid a,c-diamide synthase n=1 Tax=Rhodovulum sulfidophilum TaxID=35806 RepID=A0A0D6B5M4_RHOSU|nr:cobyrinic acid a,c-diamide synthase [Rhodovulum sulfidophilum]
MWDPSLWEYDNSQSGIRGQGHYGVEKNQFTRATYGRAIEREVLSGWGCSVARR